MLTRVEHDGEGKELPQEWKNKVKLLLNEVYEPQCKENDKHFEVFGEIYSNELLIIVSFVNFENLHSIPQTLFLSVDVDEKTDFEKLLPSLVNISGLVFDQLFALGEEDYRYEENWQKEKVKETEFYYKISRENVALTLEANKLL